MRKKLSIQNLLPFLIQVYLIRKNILEKMSYISNSSIAKSLSDVFNIIIIRYYEKGGEKMAYTYSRYRGATLNPPLGVGLGQGAEKFLIALVQSIKQAGLIFFLWYYIARKNKATRIRNVLRS